MSLWLPPRGSVAAALACAAHGQAATLHVSAATGADSGDCKAAAVPCKTITYAMSQALSGSPGDEILVAAGTYDRSLGEIFPIPIKSGVRLRSAGGPEVTVLDASGTSYYARVLQLTLASSSTSVEGFTITGGHPFQESTFDAGVPTKGGALLIFGGAPVVRGNVFVSNAARGGSTGGDAHGGAIYVADAAPTIVNNVFRGNTASGAPGSVGKIVGPGGAGRGGAVYFEGTGGTLANNTFYGNAATGGAGGYGIFFPYEGTWAAGGQASHGAVYANGPVVANNLFANNLVASGRDGGPGVSAGYAAATYGALQSTTLPSNNMFYNNSVNGAVGTDDTVGTAAVCYGVPCATGFHGEPSSLRIVPGSPAAGAGSAAAAPSDDLDGAVRAIPPAIGAYEPTAATDPARAVNISTRAQVLAGDDVLIGGFIIAGSTPKTVVVRARGPSLASFNVGAVLSNPALQLFSGATQVASNDDWGAASNASAIQSSGFAPSDPSESAILMTLDPGAYTAIVSGVAGSTGIGIVEVFEVDAVTTPLLNISTRGKVQAGNGVLIAGFIIQGGPQTVIVRARGPSLQQAGVSGFLADPVLDLFDGPVPIASNDSWGLSAKYSQIDASGYGLSDGREAAILITLQPGAYTAIVRGANSTSGIAIVEVFRN